jgi:hypothetical protein
MLQLEGILVKHSNAHKVA